MTVLTAFLSAFTLGAVILAVVLLVVDLLLARRRSWIMGFVRIALTVGAAAAAIPLALRGAEHLSVPLYDLLLSLIGDSAPAIGDHVNSFMGMVASGAEGARLVMRLVIAPILFLFLFILLRLLLSIFGWILCRCVMVLRVRDVPGVAMALGALNGVLITMVILVPLCGFLAMGGTLMTTVADTIDEERDEILVDLLDDAGTSRTELSSMGRYAAEHPLVVIVQGTVGEPVFSMLTTAEMDPSVTHGMDVSLKLESELTRLLCAGVYAVDAVDALDNDDYTPEDKVVLMAALDHALESDWVQLLATDSLVSLSGKWMANQAFLGMDRPTLDAKVQPILNSLLKILSEEEVTTLSADLHTIVDVLGDILVCDLLAESFDPSAMMTAISENGLLTHTLDKLESNAHMRPLADELEALGVRLLSDMLGLEELKNGEHDEMLTEVSAQMTESLTMSVEERHEFVSTWVRKVFEDYGYSVPEDVVIKIADRMVVELGGDGIITTEELTQYLVDNIDEGLDILPDGVIETLPDD